MQERSAQRGFTVIELLIVIVLLAVLAGVVIYGSGFIQKKARDSQRQQIMRGIAIALEAYKGAYGHYPAAGDPIPGGAVISGSNNFNSVMASIGQNQFMDSGSIEDPKFGKLFESFSGVDTFSDGVKFTRDDETCSSNSVIAQKTTTGEVFYSYYTMDGRSYEMCLMTEGGKIMTFVSPKD